MASEGPLDTVVNSLDGSAVFLTVLKRSNSLRLGLKTYFSPIHFVSVLSLLFHYWIL